MMRANEKGTPGPGMGGTAGTSGQPPTASAAFVAGKNGGMVSSIAVSPDVANHIIGVVGPIRPRLPRVLVPVQLDVLLVRAEDGAWADCRMRDPLPNPPADTPNDAEHLLPPPFRELTPDERHLRRGRGAHLHWAIPDALTAGQHTAPADGTPRVATSFPAVPDRWLVLRLSPSTGSGRHAVKGWILEADREPPVVTPLDAWTEHGPANTQNGPLTALGRGDPAWAAYYDNVQGRFGFYDDLSDIAAGPITYLVCGWYANAAQDPLGASTIHSVSAFYNALQNLGWELAGDEFAWASFERPKVVMQSSRANTGGSSIAGSGQQLSTGPDGLPTREPDSGEYLSDGSWWPTQSLFHGAAVGLGWPDDTGAGVAHVAGGPPSASALTVAVGGTIPEALAALVVQQSGDPSLGPLLEAFHLGILQEYDQPDGRAQLDATLHSSRFLSLPGGFVTETVTQSVPHYPTSGPGWHVPPGVIQGTAAQFAGSLQATGGSGQAATTVQPSAQAAQAAQAAQSAGAQFGMAQRPIVEAAEPLMAERTLGVGTTQAAMNAGTQGVSLQGSVVNLGASSVIAGKLGSILGRGNTGGGPVTYTQEQVQVKRALPRFYRPQDLVVLVQGGARCFKHGSDGIYSESGNLICRLSGFCVQSLSARVAVNVDTRIAVTGDDLLDRRIGNASVPPDCDDLLRETVLLDPGAAENAASRAFSKASQPTRATINLAQLTQNFVTEQTAWWAVRDPRVDQSRLVTNSGITGMLPSPVALTPPVKPWLPRHLDWEVEYLPTPHEAHDWSLDEIDFVPDAAAVPAPDATGGILLTGRTLLTGGAATSLAGSVKKALDDAASAGTSSNGTIDGVIRYAHPVMQQTVESFMRYAQAVQTPSAGVGGTNFSGVDRSGLQDILRALQQMDVLSGAFDRFHAKLRAALADQGVSDADLEAGFLRMRRLRLVDGYGQFLDLAGSTATAQADPNQILKAGPLSVDARPDLVALPVRFTDQARLWLRFSDGAAGPQAPGDLKAVDVDPLCGFVMPNHLDGALDFYGPDGQTLGKVCPDYTATSDTPRIVWEDAPGRPSSVGQPPSRAMADLTSPCLGALADSVLAWGRTGTAGTSEHVLSALLRVIDSTRWTVDPFSHAGEEHLALLVGHPVAVLRARLKLEVVDEKGNPSPITATVPVRLGALTHWQDGLFGYFLNDDYTTLYCVDAAAASFARPVGPLQGFLSSVADMDTVYANMTADLSTTGGTTPVDHPYVNASGVVWIQPNQDVWLTMLVEPHTTIHVTTGFVPRKDAAMRREWVTSGLAKLAPTFRFGPLLVEPKKVKMPIPMDLAGTWSWDHRANINVWSNDPVADSTGDALIPVDPPSAHEGWLQLNPPPATPPKNTGTGGDGTG